MGDKMKEQVLRKILDILNFIKRKAIRLYKYIINIKFAEISKTKLIIALAVIAVIVLIVAIANVANTPDGTTIEGRTEMLKGLGKGKGWQISTELTTEDYIISGVCSENNRAGIAIFKRDGNNYKLKTHQFRNKDEIIFEQIFIDDVWYDLIWFIGAETEYAEITYSVKGNIVENLKTRTDEMKIIHNPSPADEYTISVIYYDSEGNKYE